MKAEPFRRAVSSRRFSDGRMNDILGYPRGKNLRPRCQVGGGRFFYSKSMRGRSALQDGRVSRK